MQIAPMMVMTASLVPIERFENRLNSFDITNRFLSVALNMPGMQEVIHCDVRV